MAYTKVPKPSGNVYTNLAKPSNGFTLRAGMITALIMPVTYSVTKTIGNAYTKVNKPSGNSYTKIAKPT